MQAGGTAVWINHDIAQVNEIADALTYIDRKVLLDGAPSEVLATGAAAHLFPTLGSARARGGVFMTALYEVPRQFIMDLANNGTIHYTFSYAFVVNGFLCAFVIGPLLGGIGTMVVAKRMAFFSQAVGNAALTGVAIGVIIGESYTAPYLSMFSFCLLFGLLLNFARNRTKMSADTLIGVFLSISLAIGATALLWVSAKVNTHILDTVMFGSILTVNDTDMTVLLITAVLTLVTALPLFNHMLLASLNPSLAHVRGVRVHLLEYVFVLLLTVLDRGLREDHRRRARRSAAADPGCRRPQFESLDARFRPVEHRLLDRELHRRHLRADALGSAGAFRRRDHPRGGFDLRRDDDRSHGAASLP